MWNKDEGINLSTISVQGLPTLSAGEYRGLFISAEKDAEGKQWVTLVTPASAHIECTEYDVSHLSPNDSVDFKIFPRDGAFAMLKGDRYRLKENDNYLTNWIHLAALTAFIKEHNVTLAEPKIEWIKTAK